MKIHLRTGSFGASYFRSSISSTAVVFRSDQPLPTEGNVLLTLDGKTFFELSITQTSRAGNYQTLNYVDPIHSSTGIITRNDNEPCKTISLNSEILVRSQPPTDIEVVPLPHEFEQPLAPDSIIFRATNGACVLYPHSWNTAEALYSPDGKRFYQLVIDHYGGSNDEHGFRFEEVNTGLNGTIHRQHNEVWLNAANIGKVYFPELDRNPDWIKLRQDHPELFTQETGTPVQALGSHFRLDDQKVKSLKLEWLFDQEHRTSSPPSLRKIGLELLYGGQVFRKLPYFPPHVTMVRTPDVEEPEYLFRRDNGQYVFVTASKYRFSYDSFRLFFGDGEGMEEIMVDDVTRYRDGGTTYIRTPAGMLYSPPRKEARTAKWFSPADVIELDRIIHRIWQLNEGDTGYEEELKQLKEQLAEEHDRRGMPLQRLVPEEFQITGQGESVKIRRST